MSAATRSTRAGTAASTSSSGRWRRPEGARFAGVYPTHQYVLTVDLSLERIEASLEEIDPVFLDTPQFVSDRLSSALGREVLVKIETLNPIGSFKGRGTSVLAPSS